MGYSFIQDAGFTLQAIERLTKSLGADISNAVVNDNGHVVGFYQVKPKDQPDGGIRGEVMRFCNVERTFARKVGYFNIDGDGNVKRFPLFGKKMLKKALANRKNYHDPSVYQRSKETQ